MGWYDLFSHFYDSSLEPLYRDARARAAEVMAPRPGEVLLDLPCGTGQSFDAFAPRLLPGGSLIGVDLSDGMLRRAKERAAKHGWGHVDVRRCDVLRLDAGAIGAEGVDGALIFLGLTAFPRWEEAFERVWGLIKPGGRCVVVDVHAASPGFQGRMVNLVARADIRRRFWEPLERVSSGFQREELPARPEYGGQLLLVSGRKLAAG